MSRPTPKARVVRVLVTILILGVLFVYRQFNGGEDEAENTTAERNESSQSGSILATGLQAAPQQLALLTQVSAQEPTSAEAQAGAEASAPRYEAKANDWVKLHGCTLVEHRHNDGDSFLVAHLDENGQLTQTTFRLYFVDTPESRDKPYDDHRRRVEDQGQDLGGLSYEQALLRGQQAKAQVTALLQTKPFTVWTKWERVYDSERRFALVQVHGQAGPQWLHRALVKTGLARVHTQGIDLPAGTKRRDEEDRLEQFQQEAIDARNR